MRLRPSPLQLERNAVLLRESRHVAVIGFDLPSRFRVAQATLGKLAQRIEHEAGRRVHEVARSGVDVGVSPARSFKAGPRGVVPFSRSQLETVL